MSKLFGCNLEFVREDDYVEYFVFPKLPEGERSDEQVRTRLEECLEQCMAVVQRMVDERHYIWHKDEFQLRLRTCSEQEGLLNDESSTRSRKEQACAAPAEALPPHLHGVTHYGDNIADEWFIVYLLSALTRELNDCVARVVDADGEFLLIEAADVLPKWANPDTCEQRVYLASGCLHLVQSSPSNTVKLIPVSAAVSEIRLNPTLHRVSQKIQSCIDERLKEFADKDTNVALHHQIARLPLGVAVVLKKRPSLIAAAVRAFCERDSIDMKACRSMRYFPPEQRVRSNVCFTRCLYAMIMHSNYVPDRKIGWHLGGATNSEEHKEDLLGVKIACGFEILASQAKSDADEERSPAWRAYLRSLTAKGYFRDNLEGSADYKRLLGEAKNYFRENQTRFRTAPQVGKEILEILRSSEMDADQMLDEENNLMPSDPDDWLNISPEELDAMLLERYGPKKLFKSNGDLNAEEFTNNIAEFLDKQSIYEGIEDGSSGEDSDNDDDDDDDDDEEPKAKAKVKARGSSEFKAKVKKNRSMRRACRQNPVSSTRPASNESERKSLSTEVRSFLEFVIPEDKWDSNSDMSDYEDEDEDDLERNFEAMASAEKYVDSDIKAYMDQMDRELSKTTIGKSFVGAKKGGNKSTPSAMAEDDFDDIEAFEPIDINVNALKNMMDSYKSQIGGPGPVSHLLSAMGVGMSAAVAAPDDTSKDLTESTV